MPSTVDLYIDGIKQFSGNVPVGPYQLSAVPSISGVGNAQIVLTDALGRSSTLNVPLYGTHQLLQAGLADWSFNIGNVRDGYGTSSFDYADQTMTSATLRYGVTNYFTAEGHAEQSQETYNAGIGGVAVLGTRGGVIFGSLARSTSDGANGTQTSIGYNWNGRLFNFSVESTRTQGDYLDVASRYGPPPARAIDLAYAGITTSFFGNIGANYLRQQYPRQVSSRYAGMFWSQTVNGRFAFNLSANWNLDNSHDFNLSASITFTPHGRTAYSGTFQRSSGSSAAILEASQTVPGDGGFGWRADLRDGAGQSGGAGELDWLGDRGLVRLGVNDLSDSRYVYAEATGALVVLDGHGFLAREIDNAFALISTDGIPGVPVTLENRNIGRTDADGLYLLTQLNAYQRNQIGIDPLDLPAGIQVGNVAMLATPGDRAGTVVDFGLRRARAATVTLVDGAGKALALGTQVRTREEDTVVGFDGEVYFDKLDEHVVLKARLPSGTCTARFDYPAVLPGGVARIGPLACVMGEK